tara:strand:+ start:159 stop:356 length:198 start_codon:yes stop_codon:yes gene_type:complete
MQTKANKIVYHTELDRQGDISQDEAFKVTLEGLTMHEMNKVTEFVRDNLQKSRNQMAFKYGRMHE